MRKEIFHLTMARYCRKESTISVIFTARCEGSILLLSSVFDRKEHYNTLGMDHLSIGIFKMQVNYFPADYFTSLAGVNFSFPEKRY